MILKNNVIVCGDIHGEFKKLIFNLESKKITDSSIIIAGDCGVGFYKENYYITLFNKLNKRLIKSNNNLFLMRGNHDNPIYFNTDKRFDLEFPNINLIPDYTVLNWGDQNILCVGGAISVDRSVRKDNYDYWRDEVFIYNEYKLNEIKEDINYIITHSSPSFCFPLTKGDIVNDYWKQDKNLLSDINIERYNHNLLYDYSDKWDLKEWHYGHFHFSHKEYISEVKFVLHDIDELIELR